jgi:4-hydroxy-tetrahydrodipicolinate synthase
MMSSMWEKLPRTCAPVPTPTSPDDAIDEGALAAHLAWLSDQGLDGALILGTNGEFPSFGLRERLKIAASAKPGDVSLQMLLGVGSCSLSEAVEMTGCAVDLGYSGVLCPPPFYFRGAPIEGLAEFFLRLLDAARLPVVLYHIPAVTGVPIGDGLLDLIGSHERLAGVKDSTGDPGELQRLGRRFRDAAYYVGSDRLVSLCIANGGYGSISAAASVVPRLVASLSTAPDRQSDLDTIRSLLEEYGLGSAVKAVLRWMGFGEYSTRPPLQGLDERSGRELIEKFKKVVDSLD